MFIYTAHAKIRLNQRKLVLSEIEQTLLEPDKVIASFRNRQLARKNFAGKVLEVVFKKENDNFVIITAYWVKDQK